MAEVAPEIDVRERVRAYLCSALATHVPDVEDIFRAGYVNSLFAVQLVMFVEQEFGVEVEEDEMEIDNFRTIDAITGFAERKLAAGVGDPRR